MRGPWRLPPSGRTPVERLRSGLKASGMQMIDPGEGQPTARAPADIASLAGRQERARAWFEALRDQICAAFEALEDKLPAGARLSEHSPGRFVRSPWERSDH